MLPDDGHIVYGYWKIVGLGVVASFVLMFVAVVIEKYVTGSNGVNRFFRWVGTLGGRLPSWAKYVVTVMLVGVVALQILFGQEPIHLIVSRPSLSFGFIKIRQFGNQMDLFQKNRRSLGTKKTTDELVTRAQLLNSLNVVAKSSKTIAEASKNITEASNKMTTELKNLIAAVEHMDDDSDKTDTK